MAYMPKPEFVPLVTAEELLIAEGQRDRIGTFLLLKSSEIISVLVVDDKHGDRTVAVFSGVETLPGFQRRGTFWRHLGIPCVRQTVAMGFERLEAVTWVFNRKGIPLYKRAGFRAIPGTSLIMENYIPMILRHPECQPFFQQHDFLRTLQGDRTYGYDSVTVNDLEVFSYRWEAGGDSLDVLVDWNVKRVVAVQSSMTIADTRMAVPAI